MGGLDLNAWMLIGFVLTMAAVVANDSLQTLGTFISSNAARTPKAVQMAFLCAVTVAVLGLGWGLNQGDPAWGRLKHFPLPDIVSWVYVIPPLAVLGLTAWGAPVSTSFLVLSSFAPETVVQLVGRSLAGYGLAFGVGFGAWRVGLWRLERWVAATPLEDAQSHQLWRVLQWLSTALLWSTWMVQDLANIFVYLPRQLTLMELASCSLVLCLGISLLVASGGGPIQEVVRSKTNTTDLRSATVIDGLFGLCLLSSALVNSFPLSTTWVFLGLLGGREIALHRQESPTKVTSDGDNCALRQSLGKDLWKAAVGLTVSLSIGIGLQPLVLWSTGF